MLLLMAFHAASGQEVSGFVEQRFVNQFGVSGTSWQSIQRFRPSFEGEIGERFTLTATIEAELVEGRDLSGEVRTLLQKSDLGEVGFSEFFPDQSLLDLAGCTWPEKKANQVFQIDGFDDWVRVDRLHVDAYLPGVDLRIGRQAVQWGSAQLINPTDPFPQVLFVEPWRFRAGINAAKATIPMGSHQVQLLAGSDDTFLHPRLASRATLNAVGTDFSGVLAYRGETDEGILGLDVRGTAVVGFWFEGAWHLEKDPYEEFAVGLDYSFPVLQQFVFGGQYYRNGSGAKQATGNGAAARLAESVELPTCVGSDDIEGADLGIDLGFGDVAADPYAPFTSGIDYGLLYLQIGFVPALSTNFSAIQNLRDGSGVLVPTVTVLPNGWSQLALAAQIPYDLGGNGGEFRPNDSALRNTFETGFTDPVVLDFSPLVADFSLIAWARANF